MTVNLSLKLDQEKVSLNYGLMC